MTLIELRDVLNFVNSPTGDLQVILYALLNNNEIFKLDIVYDDLPSLRNIFITEINESILAKEDLSVIPLSSCDERRNCILEYDLGEKPEEFTFLNNVIGNDDIQDLNIRHNNFSEIKSLIIVIADNSHHISLYKSISQIEIIGRKGYLMGKKSNTIFKRYEHELLRISPKFQLLYVDDNLFVMDLKMLERIFGFTDIIHREALKGIEQIGNMNLISNIETLSEMLGDLTFARKLTKIASHSPVIIHHIPNNEIINFAKNHPATKNKIRFTADENQILLDTKVSKNLFLKILNDDFLTSELTSQYYDSLAKDSINVEVEEN